MSEDYTPRWPIIYELANKIDELITNKCKELSEKKEHAVIIDEVELILREIKKTCDEFKTKDWVKDKLTEEGMIDKPSPQMSKKPEGIHYA